MEIRTFAEQVLLSGDLGAKLFSPTDFTDNAPGPSVDPPRAPGRPAYLPLIPTRKIPEAPTPASLASETVRGQALHTFAHHELMALELMALALLRFPDAPAGFRMGLARIICDEQRHFQLYRERSEYWGTELGDVGVGHFFWDTVAPLDTPISFLAALSLTYEQANLDFTRYWKQAFTAVGDTETAEVLSAVYEDEIRHVGHGVHWFARLAGQVDYQTYSKALVFPMSPGRAKGPIFDREGRLRAGLAPAFIDEMQIRNVSRGRPPRLFSFHPFVEEDVAGRAQAARVRFIERDLGSLPMFLCHREDVVIGTRPGLGMLKRLHEAGFEIPQFAEAPGDLGDRAIGALCPWGWSPGVAKSLGRTWDPAHRLLYDKTWAFERRRDLLKSSDSSVLAPLAGAVCGQLHDVEALVGSGGTWIAKAPFSSSGQHRIRLRGTADAPALRWLERTLADGPIVVEPWYERVADLSMQLEVGADDTQIVGISRFWTAGNGSYRGALIDSWTRGLPAEVARFAHGGVRRGAVTLALEQAAFAVADGARALGYRGPAGIDAMIVRVDGQLALVPILEVNPRYSMGRVALRLRERCAGHGRWLFLQRAQIEAARGSVQGFVDAVEAVPLVVDGGLRQGALFTNDPHTAEQIFTLLVVGPTPQQTSEILAGLGL